MDKEYELSAKRVERNVMRVELDEAELWDSDEYQRILKRIAALESQVTREESTDSDSLTSVESHT